MADMKSVEGSRPDPKSTPHPDPRPNPRPNPKGRLLIAAVPLVLFAALVAVFAYLLLQDGRDTSEIPSALIGKPAPTFSLPPLEGLKRDGAPVPALASSDLTGKIHIVNIFASWCAPCRAEHPILMNLAKRDGISIVGINYKDRPANALRFLGSLGNPYDRVGADLKGRAAIDWGFYGIPETLLIAPDGTVRHKIVGPIGPEQLERLDAEIAKLRAN
ncbi:MAG: DsbE family thiol:disulfide interchange protein [Pseudomonadota bacterium]